MEVGCAFGIYAVDNDNRKVEAGMADVYAGCELFKL
jgi:hypothetical protein